jgi:hypothetical protein
MIWAQLLAYVTGTVDQELRLRNEYPGSAANLTLPTARFTVSFVYPCSDFAVERFTFKGTFGS